MDSREGLSQILQLLGLGPLEARLYAAGTAFRRSSERMRIRTLSVAIPAAVWTVILLAGLIAIVRAVRALATAGDDSPSDVAGAPLPEPAPALQEAEDTVPDEASPVAPPVALPPAHVTTE
jgi:hypothetical protein